MEKAIIVLDYINDIASEEGKLAGKGYADYIKQNEVLKNLKNDLDTAIKNNYKTIFVKVAFKETYEDQPKQSPLFGKADQFQALKENSWGTNFIDMLNQYKPDLILTKNRVSAFINPKLHEYLKEQNISQLYLAGVATDLTVLATSLTAHDKDYVVNILTKSCAAANKEDHNSALRIMSKYAKLI